MLNREEWMDIHLLSRQGHSIRSIARLPNLSGNTVRRALRQEHVHQPYDTSNRNSNPKTARRGVRLDFVDICRLEETFAYEAKRMQSTSQTINDGTAAKQRRELRIRASSDAKRLL